MASHLHFHANKCEVSSCLFLHCFFILSDFLATEIICAIFYHHILRFVVFPVAIVIGSLGYIIESKYKLTPVELTSIYFLIPTDMVSSKYTPFAPSIEQTRIERLTSNEALDHVMEKKQQRYESIFDKESNLSESLRRK